MIYCATSRVDLVCVLEVEIKAVCCFEILVNIDRIVCCVSNNYVAGLDRSRKRRILEIAELYRNDLLALALQEHASFFEPAVTVRQ